MSGDVVYRVRTVYVAETQSADAAIERFGAHVEAVGRRTQRALDLERNGALGRLTGAFPQIARGLAAAEQAAARAREEAAARAAAANAQMAATLSSGAQAAAGVLDRLVGSLVRVGTAALTAAGAAGIGAVVRGVTVLNAQAESTQIALAGMLQAGGAAPNITRALRDSGQLLEGMRRDARALPGEFQDVVNIFRGGLTGGLSAGRTPEQIRAVAGQLMAVTRVMGIDSEQAGRDFALMLEGRAGAQVATFARLRAQIGVTAQAFNQLAPAERFARIERSLRGFGPAIREYEHSWEAISSTTKDHVLALVRGATSPLFERVKGQLQRVNEWFERNQARVERFTRTVGDGLARAFDRVVGVVERLGERLAALNPSAVLDRVRGAGTGLLLARGALGLVGSRAGAGMLTAVGGALGGGAATGALALGAAVAPMVVALATGAVDIRRLSADIASALVPLVHVGERLVGALTPVVATIGRLQIGILEHALERMTPMLNALDSLTGALERAAGAIGDTFSRVLPESVSGIFGRLNWGRIVGDAVMTSVGAAVPQLGALFAAARVVGFARSGTSERDNFSLGGDDGRVMGFRGGSTAANLAIDAARNRADRPRAAAATNVNVRVTIEQTINDASDPDRVYVDTHRAIRAALQFPIESPTSDATVLR